MDAATAATVGGPSEPTTLTPEDHHQIYEDVIRAGSRSADIATAIEGAVGRALAAYGLPTRADFAAGGNDAMYSQARNEGYSSDLVALEDSPLIRAIAAKLGIPVPPKVAG